MYQTTRNEHYITIIKLLEFTVMASYTQFSCHFVTPPRLLMAANTSPGIRNEIQQLI